MKDRRTYDFNPEARPGKTTGVVRELLVDGWSAYYAWQLKLRKRMATHQPNPASK